MPAENAIIRPARVDDAETLTDIAMRAKAHWGYSDEFMRACRGELTVTPAGIEDGPCVYFTLESDGSTAAFVAIGPVRDNTWEIEALFVDPPFMGRGLGRQLMTRACTEAAARGAQLLTVLSDPYAEAFYRAMGCERTGERESGSIPGRFLPVLELALPTP